MSTIVKIDVGQHWKRHINVSPNGSIIADPNTYEVFAVGEKEVVFSLPSGTLFVFDHEEIGKMYLVNDD